MCKWCAWKERSIMEYTLKGLCAQLCDNMKKSKPELWESSYLLPTVEKARSSKTNVCFFHFIGRHKDTEIRLPPTHHQYLGYLYLRGRPEHIFSLYNPNQYNHILLLFCLIATCTISNSFYATAKQDLIQMSKDSNHNNLCFLLKHSAWELATSGGKT